LRKISELETCDNVAMNANEMQKSNEANSQREGLSYQLNAQQPRLHILRPHALVGRVNLPVIADPARKKKQSEMSTCDEE
jgi:hypothetical protein